MFVLCVCVCACVSSKAFQIEWWHYRAKDTITIATSRDNALVRAVEYLLCGGLELDQQAQRIPSFIHYHLSHSIFFLYITVVVLQKKLREMEQLPSFYNTNSHAHRNLRCHCSSHIAAKCTIINVLIITKTLRSFTRSAPP